MKRRDEEMEDPVDIIREAGITTVHAVTGCHSCPLTSYRDGWTVCALDRDINAEGTDVPERCPLRAAVHLITLADSAAR